MVYRKKNGKWLVSQISDDDELEGKNKDLSLIRTTLYSSAEQSEEGHLSA